MEANLLAMTLFAGPAILFDFFCNSALHPSIPSHYSILNGANILLLRYLFGGLCGNSFEIFSLYLYVLTRNAPGPATGILMRTRSMFHIFRSSVRCVA